MCSGNGVVSPRNYDEQVHTYMNWYHLILCFHIALFHPVANGKRMYKLYIFKSHAYILPNHFLCNRGERLFFMEIQ